MLATQQQVLAAIRSSGAGGTPAEVLATVTEPVLEKRRGERINSTDLFLLAGEDQARLFLTKIKQASSQDPILEDSLRVFASRGYDFAEPPMLSMLDKLVGRGVFTRPQANALIGLSKWQESHLEAVAGRGATTDLETVQAALAAIAQNELRARLSAAYNDTVAAMGEGVIITWEQAIERMQAG